MAKVEAGCISNGNSRWIPAFTKKDDVSYDWLLEGKGPMALSEYHVEMRELKALPELIANQMVRGDRPKLRVVK